MKKILSALLFIPVIAFANPPHYENYAKSNSVGVGVGLSKSNSTALGVGGDSLANGSGGNSNVEFKNDYPNQAPAVFTTSAPSYSQRNCTPVGSVNASGPFGGLGIAFPMGGDVCNGLNTADKLADWERETGDMKLWLVQCNLMVEANDDLEEAFEKSGYSCKDAYIQRQAEANTRAKMTALINR